MISKKILKKTKEINPTSERFRMLYEISAINSSNPDVQLDAILIIASRIFGLDIGIISKIEGDAYTVLNFFHPDNTLKKGQEFLLSNTYCAITLQKDDVEAIHHMKNSAYASHPCYDVFQLEAYIGVPLLVNGKRFGTLNFSSPKPLPVPFTEEDKRMMRIMGSWVSNILQNKENLLALRKSEAQYKMLVENGLALMCIHDKDGNIIQVNKTALQALGYTYEEMVGKNLKQFMVPSHPKAFENYLERITINKSDEGVLSILTKEGKLCYWSYKNTLENGQIIGFSQDVTDKINAEKTLIEQEHNLKEAQALAKIGSWKLDLLSNRIFWSEETFNIFGLDPKQPEPLLEEFLQMIHPGDKMNLKLSIEKAISQREAFSIELRIVLNNGLIKYVQIKGRPYIDKTEKVTQIIGVVQDITENILVNQELIAAKEMAEEAARIKQEFLANMSHEIRTPMNAIMGFARLLLQAKLHEENHQYAQTIYESADTLLVIINDILDFSKIEAGKLPIVPVHFDLIKSLDSLQKFFSVKVDEKSVRLIFETDENIPAALVGDPVRITQILSNLLNNAIKFTENGFVLVNTSLHSQKDDEYIIQFSVKDSGIGIPDEKIKTIFNSFEQAEGDITRRFGGTGLGLTIVKKLIELMNGQVQVNSQEGAGSVFTVALPLKKGDVKKIKTEEINDIHSLPLDLLHGKRILLAEDNRNNQVLATKILSDVGCQVEIAETGKEAIDQIKNKEFDAILMDIQMPELDGLQATKIIKSLAPPLNAIPIIAMTAHALKEEENKYRKVGMEDYISKPFKPDVLYVKLLHVFGHFENNIKNTTASPKSNPYQPEQITFDSLKQIAGDDQGFFTNMLQIFIQDVPDYLSTIKTSSQQKNWEELKRTVHTLKSSISLIGMKNTTSIINEIESGNLDEIAFEAICSKCDYIIENCEKAIALAKQEIP